jgi:hypothetical protein
LLAHLAEVGALRRAIKPPRTSKTLISLCDLVHLCETNALNLSVKDRKMGLWCQVVNLSAYFLGISEVFCHTPALLEKSLFIKDL